MSYLKKYYQKEKDGELSELPKTLYFLVFVYKNGNYSLDDSAYSTYNEAYSASRDLEFKRVQDPNLKRVYVYEGRYSK